MADRIGQRFGNYRLIRHSASSAPKGNAGRAKRCYNICATGRRCPVLCPQQEGDSSRHQT